MHEPELARRVADELADALAECRPIGDGATGFARDIESALRLAPLLPNPAAPEVAAYEGWEAVVQRSLAAADDGLHEAIARIGRELSWIDGTRFWPGEEHSFARRILGSLMAGDHESAYLTDGRYIALLMVVEPNTTYPPHAHQIQEGYYVIAGRGEWTVDGDPWRPHEAGTLVHVPSCDSHGIRTGDEPLVCMNLYLPPFGWEGDLV